MNRAWRGLAAVALAMALGGCVTTTTLYAHRTIEGAPFRFQALSKITEGMSFDEVRESLGPPLEVKEAGETVTWRYFERANPMWCDGGSAKAVAPEYSIQATFVFRTGALVLREVKQSGALSFP